MSVSSCINKLIPHVRYGVRKQKPDKTLQLSDDPTLYSPIQNRPTQRGDLPIYIFDNVLFWPGQSIASRDSYLIEQTYIDKDRINTVNKRRLLRRYPIINYYGWATSIDYIFSPHNYYHQYIDSIPRAWALKHPSLKSLPITVFLTRQLCYDQKRILAALLPQNVKIRIVPRCIRIRADHYIHLPFLSKNRTGYNPTQTLTSAGFIPNEYLESYRNIFFEKNKISKNNSNRKLIYVSRRKAMKRRIVNEEEVVIYLRNKGFVIVELEGMSLSEQAQLFADSNIIIAQHGAALTNLLYIRNGGIIEIFSSKETPHHYAEHARTLDLYYEAINLNYSDKNSDVYLPIDLLDRALINAFNAIGIN